MKILMNVLFALMGYCVAVIVVHMRAVKSTLDEHKKQQVDAWFASRCRNPDGTRNWSNNT